MDNYKDPQASDRDPQLWEIAKRRASFKYHLATYIVINLFLWAIWFFTSDAGDMRDKYPWPIWSTLGWGIGLLFHFLGAYVFRKENSVEWEYEKLIRNKKN
jgi:2TM domain